MRWPWETPTDKSTEDKRNHDWLSSGPLPEKAPTDWINTPQTNPWTDPHVLFPTFVLTAGTLAALKFYTFFLRRIPQATYIHPSALNGKRSIFGYVSSVGDGDTFRLYHTPGGRLLGWGWLPGRRVQDFERKDFKDQTIAVRIAGVDAPELAHFGKPAQVYGKQACEGLQDLVGGRFVRARLWRQDQYQRVVASVVVRRWGVIARDVGMEMLRRGHATVYEAKFGSEFAGKEEKYRQAEKLAKSHGVGLWRGQGDPGLRTWWQNLFTSSKSKKAFETPRQFKDRTKELTAEPKAVEKR